MTELQNQREKMATTEMAMTVARFLKPPAPSADDLHHEQSLKVWGRVLNDEDLAQAIIARVLEGGRLLRLDGPSVRMLPALSVFFGVSISSALSKAG